MVRGLRGVKSGFPQAESTKGQRRQGRRPVLEHLSEMRNSGMEKAELGFL